MLLSYFLLRFSFTSPHHICALLFFRNVQQTVTNFRQSGMRFALPLVLSEENALNPLKVLTNQLN